MALSRYLVTLALSGSLYSLPMFASTIAIIDSGLDVQHKDLKDKIWLNSGDSSFDKVDNDGNGFIDDVHGWNFTSYDGNLIDYKYLKLYEADIEKYFDLQGKALKGQAKQGDVEWLKAKVKDKAFIKKLQTFGNFVHGTHVTGLAVEGNPDARALAIKLIPTENPLASLQNDILRAVDEGKEPNWIVKELIKVGLALFAKLQGVPFAEVGKYLGQNQVDVANASLGMGKMQAEMIIKPLLKLAARGQEPSEALLHEMLVYFLNCVNAEQEQLIKNSPHTLFVFAAGNDGLSNDEYPSAPASIQNPFKISVAASFENGSLTSFSNYGQSVDVAAPGVAMVSTIPGDKYLPLSGTSQAAPYVAGLAAHIKDLNPELDALEIKKIIMKTVDKLESLKAKVASGGVVNKKRACPIEGGF
ncbi:MAG: S8 family serine peptidase [Proteobacteria bacterium]|nr:S8 family serine peptidase [Pseudomonadota bacterium]